MNLTGKCTCCHTDNVDTQHFDLPVFGSEGVWLCLECRKATCNAITERAYTFMRTKRDAVLERKRRRSEAWARDVLDLSK